MKNREEQEENRQRDSPPFSMMFLFGLQLCLIHFQSSFRHKTILCVLFPMFFLSDSRYGWLMNG